MDPCSGTDSMVVSFGLRPSTKKATRATKPLSIHMFKTCQTHISCQVQDLILWHEIGMMGHFNYIFVFSPALPNPTTGCGGKVETEPLQPNSSGHPKSPPNWWIYVSRLDQSMYRRQMRYPNLKHLTFPRYNEKRCGVRLHEVQIHCIVDLMNRDCELFLRGF